MSPLIMRYQPLTFHSVHIGMQWFIKLALAWHKLIGILLQSFETAWLLNSFGFFLWFLYNNLLSIWSLTDKVCNLWLTLNSQSNCTTSWKKIILRTFRSYLCNLISLQCAVQSIITPIIQKTLQKTTKNIIESLCLYVCASMTKYFSNGDHFLSVMLQNERL